MLCNGRNHHHYHHDHHHLLPIQSVSEEQLLHLFSTFGGLEYCDLKRERTTGESKVGRGVHAVCTGVYM